MADTSLSDPLNLLRMSISSSSPPVLSTTTSPPTPGSPPVPLQQATHLIFRVPPSQPPQAVPLNTPTRFHKKNSDAGPVDLRSIYFAWLNKDLAIPDYVALAQGFTGIKNLVFVERLELVSWLEGVQPGSEFIAPLEKAKGAAGTGGMVVGRSRDAGPGQAQRDGGIAGQGVVSGPRPARQIDPRLIEIYSHERVILNRNTALRGAKTMDFSYVRKHTEDFVSRLKTAPKLAPGTGKPGETGNSGSSGQLTKSPSKPSSRPIPIILLSPSASALLNMGNIKAFLETGTFVPPSSTASSAATPQMIDVSRTIPSINPNAAQRFIVVDSADMFKPEYWRRVVAVFTTGQAWQFKDYWWHRPAELFRHVRGFYVGYEGDPLPETVRTWGSGVKCVAVDRNRRFRDREVCEIVWMEIERWMASSGWGQAGRM